MSKSLYFLIHKPYKVLSQFTDEHGNPGLGSLFDLPRDVYPVGRLDLDSEGLLILTNDKGLNHRLLDPKFEHRRKYYVQLENEPAPEDIKQLESGIEISFKKTRYHTRPAQVRLIEPPELKDREPPVNLKKYPKTQWAEIELTEGKNRQVRRMFASVESPVLRLVRVSIEALDLKPLQSGEISQISKNVLYKKLFGEAPIRI